MTNGFQTTRYEHKYVIDPAKAQAVRAFVSGRLPADRYMLPHSHLGYAVYSLYLDSPQTRLLCHQTQEGVKNRFKLRIRFYDQHPQAPAFLELKQRTTDAIRKYRVAVTKQAAAKFLAEGTLGPDDLLSKEESAYRAWRLFMDKCQQLNAVGSVFTSYHRAAYVDDVAGGVRVTFDSNLEARPYVHGNGLVLPKQFDSAQSGFVVLEMKFTDRCPQWMCDLAALFGLQRTSFPKYVRCCHVLGPMSASGRPTGRGQPLHSGQLTGSERSQF